VHDEHPLANARDDVKAYHDGSILTLVGALTNEGVNSNHWAGVLPASADGDKFLFYWLFAPPPNYLVAEGDIPLIIWHNVGPGYSSMDVLWIEKGPFRLAKRNGTWRLDIADNS
jgi:carboxypeptidase C (cathepsin A)